MTSKSDIERSALKMDAGIWNGFQTDAEQGIAFSITALKDSISSNLGLARQGSFTRPNTTAEW